VRTKAHDVEVAIRRQGLEEKLKSTAER
jgi:hypothetical protein